jgi:glycosyltransferase involved in cell wall biosynthesis
VPVVVYQIVKGLNRVVYEPLVFFETHVQSDLRKQMHESDVLTVDLKKCSKTGNDNFPVIRRNFDISGKLERGFGNRAGKFYISIKHFQKLLTHQLPRVKKFKKAFKKYRADLIHTHSNLYSGKAEIIAAWMLGIPCISHNHGYSNITNFDKIFSRLIDRFIYISEDVAKFCNPNMKTIKNGKIIHNGIDVNKFIKQYNTFEVREEFSIEKDQPLIGIVGRLDWWKGHEYFIEAFAKANQSISGLKGLIIGSLENKVAVSQNKRYYQKLKALIRKYNLNDKIVFTGFRNDIPKLMAALDVVVHASSIPEPFGIVIIEGMAAGKPVIATAAGGVLEIIDHEENGLLVPCKDSDTMAKAIVDVLSNPDKARKLGVKARNCVLNKFSIQAQINAIQQIYDSIIEGS